MDRRSTSLRDEIRTSTARYLGCDEMELGFEWEAFVQAIADVICLPSNDAALAVGRLALSAAAVVKL